MGPKFAFKHVSAFDYGWSRPTNLLLGRLLMPSEPNDSPRLIIKRPSLIQSQDQ